MPELDERLLQFIWQHRLFDQNDLKTVSGQALSVISPGLLNPDAGPDFFNAQLRLDGIVLAGSVEVHLRSSHWLRHGHQRNPAYDRLILHVVYEHDRVVPQNEAFGVEVLELRSRVPAQVLSTYGVLAHSKNKLPCSSQLQQVNDLQFAIWLQQMAARRLNDQLAALQAQFDANGADYTRLLYMNVVRSFGFSVNAAAFQLLAQQLPFLIVARHAANRLQLEALLFGMAGFLDEQIEAQPLRELQNEFEFLRKKYQLVPLKKELFRFATMRPANFPTVRLAQLAALVHTHSRLFFAPLAYAGYQPLKATLSVTVTGYWAGHFKADGAPTSQGAALGANAVDALITNAFAPFYFFYGKKTGRPEFCRLGLQLLERCRFEWNRKTRLFEKKKQVFTNSAHSQALLHLHNHYCQKKACLGCAVGAQLLGRGF